MLIRSSVFVDIRDGSQVFKSSEQDFGYILKVGGKAHRDRVPKRLFASWTYTIEFLSCQLFIDLG